MKLIAGIDPGKTGAIAIIAEKMEILNVHDWESPRAASDFLDIWKRGDISFAILEKVHSFPGQGVKSVWSFAENFGVWEGILSAMEIPFQLIPPRQWMKGQITPSDHIKVKKRGLTVCRRLYPKSNWFRLERHDGRADAVLMARYAILGGLI